MTDLIKQLVEAKILDPDHGFADDAAVLQTLNSALVERQQLQQQVATLKKAAETPAPAEPTTPTKPAAPAAAPQTSTSVNIDSARALRDKGLLEKDTATGLWKARDASFQSFADQLNEHDMQVQRKTQQMNELLVTDPEKFVEEFLADAIDKRAKSHIEPLQSELDKFVRQPSAADIWYNENRDRLEAENSPLAKAYNEIHQELVQEHGHLKEALGDRFDDYIHSMTGPRAELAAKSVESVATPPGDGQTQVTQTPSSETAPSTTSTDGRSLVDRVNDGDGAGANGERNNGSARLLNDHANQVGDANAPVTSQGRVNFHALAEQTASELGINLQ